MLVVTRLRTPSPHAAAEAELRAGLLSTQLLGIALTRYVLRLPPVVAMADETVVAITTEFVDRILHGPLPVRT